MPSTNRNNTGLYVLLAVGLGLVVAVFIVMTGVFGKKSVQTVMVIPPTPVPTSTPQPTTVEKPIAMISTTPTETTEATPVKEKYLLADTDWMVSELNGYPYSSNDLDKAGISLKFIGRTTLSGFDGCGNYKATYKENSVKGSLYIDPEILMDVVTPTPDESGNIGPYCEGLNDEAKQARLELFKRLPNVTKYSIDDTMLKLYDQDGTLIIVAKKTS